MRQMLTNQPKKIGHMEFGLLSPKEVRGLSATKVITVHRRFGYRDYRDRLS